MPARPTIAAPVLLTWLLLAGCGEDPGPLEVPGPEVRGGNAGVDQRVGEHVTVADVELAFPEDGVYEEGEDAPLQLAITNTGTDPAVLTGVSGPAFAGVGTVGGALPLEVPPDDTTYVGAEGAPAIVLQDLSERLRSSESIPVTLTFARTGEVTVEAVVEAAGQDPRSDVDLADPDRDPSDG